MQFPAGFYREKALRLHYATRHKLDFGSAPLPRTKSAMDNVQLYDHNSKNKVCFICGKKIKAKYRLRELVNLY